MTKCAKCGIDFDELLGQLTKLLGELKLLKNDINLQENSNTELDQNQLYSKNE